MANKAIPLEKDPKLKDLQQTLVAVDGTLLPALPKMLWRLWVDDQHRADKLHLERLLGQSELLTNLKSMVQI